MTRIPVKLPDAVLSHLTAYTREHDVDRSHAIRIAIMRLRRPPTRQEREELRGRPGNPTPEVGGRAGGRGRPKRDD